MGLFRKGMQNYDEYDWKIAQELNPPSPIPQSSLQDSPVKIGPTEFKGIVFTLQDGSTEFLEPHPEVKEEVENWLNEGFKWPEIKPRGPLTQKECETWLLDWVWPVADPISGSFKEGIVQCELSVLAERLRGVQTFAAYHATRAPELWKKETQSNESKV